MIFHETDFDKTAVSHNYFDKKGKQQVAAFKNGDLLIIRFNDECRLGFEASILVKKKLLSPAARRKTAAWLINLLKNNEQHDKRVRAALAQESAFSQEEFQIVVPGIRLDEKHALRLVNIEVNPDLTSSMFSSVMGYSWVPPSGEE